MTPNAVLGWALLIALGLSLAGNVWLFHERDGLIAREATVKQLEADTRVVAQSCTKSVDDLAAAGKARQRDLLASLAAIAPTVSMYQAEAIGALQARPADPQDLCGSLLKFWQAEIRREHPAAQNSAGAVR